MSKLKIILIISIFILSIIVIRQGYQILMTEQAKNQFRKLIENENMRFKRKRTFSESTNLSQENKVPVEVRWDYK